MTNYNKSTLATFFATGDVPTGTDYANLINSQVNLVETAGQAMAGPLTTTELDTALVSATNINATVNVSAAAISVAGEVSAAGVNVLNSVRCSALRFTAANAIGIVSATGTAQATAAALTYTVNRLQGVTDGQATGFVLLPPSTYIGTEVWAINETAVSANLWPSVGCGINGKSANTVFALAANQAYKIITTYASGYGVR